MATGTSSYLTRAQTDFPNMPDASQSTTPEYAWTAEWDDDSFADYIWMAELTGQQQYITDAENNLNRWTTGFDGSEVSYSPGGEAFLTNWGSLRYSANEAFLALVFAGYLTDNGLSPALTTTYHNFAVQQINYILGQNPEGISYEVGFTNDGASTAWPQYPHNAPAHGSWDDNLSVPAQTRRLDYGLLVGGPDADNDQYTDSRSNYEESEGAIDYEALFSGDLAALTQEYGGAQIADFPAPETPDGPQVYMQAAINNEGTNFIEIKALVNNQSACPARQMPDASFRYYFTLDPGETASQITLSSPYNQCDITFPAAHNPAEDWSFQGIPSAVGATPVTVSDITLYSGNTLVWGTPPSTVTLPSAPGSLTAGSVTPVGATLSWTASTAGTNPIAGYDVYTSSGTLAGTTTGTSYPLTGLNADRTSPYGYYVQAVDSSGAVSPASNIAQFITSPSTSLTADDALPPSSPGRPPRRRGSRWACGYLL